MLGDRALSSAVQLSEILTDSNRCLSVLPNTPLNAAVLAAYHPQLDTTNAFADVTIEIRDTIQMVDRSENTAITHEETIMSVVETVKQTVSTNLKLAQSIVNPMIKDVYKDAVERIKEEYHGRANFLDILPVFYRDIWSSAVLEGMVEKHKDSAIEKLRPLEFIPEKSPEDILGLLKSGSSRFNKELDAFVADYGAEEVVTLFNDVFLSGQIREKSSMSRAQFTVDSKLPEVRDDLILLYMFAETLLVSPIEGVRADKGTYETALSILISQCGRKICRWLDKREEDLRHNNLSILWPSYAGDYQDSDTVIKVNGDVYNKWLEQGGSPEVLFGSYVTDKEVNYNRLLDMSERYTLAWQRALRIRENECLNRKHTITAIAIRQAMEKAIRGFNAQASFGDDPAVVGLFTSDTLSKRLMDCKVLKSLSSKDLDDIYRVVQLCVCRVMFPHTEAENILSEIDNIGKRYPDLDARECAAVATINIVTDWVCLMLTAEEIQLSPEHKVA